MNTRQGSLRADYKERRQKEAAERQKVTGEQSPKQRLEALDRLFGAGLGAKRERARLAVKLNKAAQ